MLGLSPDLKIDEVFRSQTMWITNYHCCKQDPGRGGEEQQPGHVITFPRCGVYALHIDGQLVVADPNTIIFHNHHSAYRTSHPYGCGDCGGGFVLRPDILLEIVRRHDPSAVERPEAPFPFTHGPCDSRICLLQRMLWRQIGSGAMNDSLEIEEIVLQLVDGAIGAACRHSGKSAEMQRAAGRSSTARAHAAYADAVKGLLATRMREQLGLDDIAKAVHCSPYHLARLFRRQTGTTIHQYLNRLRLRVSLDYLADRGMDLAQVAQELGFCSHSHFSDAFRREFGVSPSRVRRAIAGSNNGSPSSLAATLGHVNGQNA